jgi:hypothetical protein
VPALPTPQPTIRLKRLATNIPPQQTELASPTKRRRVSDTAARAKAPAKKK